ncbi:epoxide hydrolase N-terminal domain-containing protein, partial [Rhizobium johnstonii]|uniref:epoxide hydrolase N-terminal domain-containing protein n=1 Tax=Rhizobium johnstonii TaxID=3019933 RepID=UPI003F94D13B
GGGSARNILLPIYQQFTEGFSSFKVSRAKMLIDGVDIHFIHVKAKRDGALPIIVTHGWPGSIIEQMKIIEPLTNPTAHGGSASDAF